MTEPGMERPPVGSIIRVSSIVGSGSRFFFSKLRCRADDLQAVETRMNNISRSIMMTTSERDPRASGGDGRSTECRHPHGPTTTTPGARRQPPGGGVAVGSRSSSSARQRGRAVAPASERDLAHRHCYSGLRFCCGFATASNDQHQGTTRNPQGVAGTPGPWPANHSPRTGSPAGWAAVSSSMAPPPAEAAVVAGFSPERGIELLRQFLQAVGPQFTAALDSVIVPPYVNAPNPYDAALLVLGVAVETLLKAVSWLVAGANGENESEAVRLSASSVQTASFEATPIQCKVMSFGSFLFSLH